ncbi:hypothetical protein D9758_010145 [Tetrapyrgos nigripes]|uniref:Uncharacterized protein n=1 Tax=Tetrapyrgos nigripes TaxID=182062 RepID=A0A8H5FSB9_9AGAR|nr:hypothetical protein D9758_010145 [Tetrapyrgos nigripes]
MTSAVEQAPTRLEPKALPSSIEFTLSPDRTQYVRRLHGRERSSACSSQYSEGCMHQYGNVHMAFKEPISQQELYRLARVAWMKLRFQAPWIAYRCSALENASEPNTFFFSYDVVGHNPKLAPNGLKPLEAWADESIVMHDELMTFAEWEMEMKEVFWLPSEGHFGTELHIARGVDDRHWLLMFSIPHSTTDARGMFSLSDVYFKLLTKEAQGSKRSDYVPYQKLPWGEEVIRLTPAPSVMIPDVGEERPLIPDPSTKVQFTRQPFPSQSIPISLNHRLLRGDSLLDKIVLSPSETRAISLVCSKARCTLTTLLNSVLLLADVERTLKTLYADAKKQNSQSLLNMIEENWQKSETWTIPANPVDIRSYMYPRYQALHGTGTSGGVVNLMVPTYHSMTAIRKCLSFKDGKVYRAWHDNPAYFWDDLLKDTKTLLKAGSKASSASSLLLDQPPSAFHKSVILAEQLSPLIGTPGSESLFPKPIGMIPSSIGSMERLGLYRDISPLTQKAKMGTDAEPPFLMVDMAVGVRTNNTMLTTTTIWEYNGTIVMNTQASKRHQTAEGWEIFGQAVRDGLKEIVKGVISEKKTTRAVL